MFESKKVEHKNVDITLTALVEKYIGTNYVSVTYKPDGGAEVWIGTSRDDAGKDKNKEN